MGYNTDGLTLNTLRNANEARQDESFPQCDEWTTCDFVECVVGELGEFANLHKKFRRGSITKEKFEANAGKELADVLIYLDILAKSVGVNLGQATIAKFNEVSERVGSKIEILQDGSDYRINK